MTYKGIVRHLGDNPPTVMSSRCEVTIIKGTQLTTIVAKMVDGRQGDSIFLLLVVVASLHMKRVQFDKDNENLYAGLGRYSDCSV